jgi:HEAT repeat-containing protein 5
MEKNTLLACTILFSSASNAFSPNDPLIPRLAASIGDCLSSRLPSNVAASCSRSLLLYPKRHPADGALAATLLPHLLSFIATPSPSDADLVPSKVQICRALTALLSSPVITPSSLSTALAIVVPALLARGESEGASSYGDLAERLLECAAAGQDAFRGAVGALDGAQRVLLEEIVREGGVRESRVEEKEEPRIALKMDFAVG